jgi:hypothetical protein
VSAADDAGEEEVGGVAAAAGYVLAAFAQDRLRALEGELVDERLVDAVEEAVAPADPACVGGVADDPVHGRVPPAGRRRGRVLVTQLAGDRDRAQPLARVEVEDPAHDRCLYPIGYKGALLVGEEVTERWPARVPAALLCATFDAGRDAVDDRGVLELGEHGKHLQHHPPGRRAGVERLRRRAQGHSVGVKLLGQPGELAHLAGEPIDPVDEQQIDAALAGEIERGLQARPIELGAVARSS